MTVEGIAVSATGAASIARGHPWLFRSSVLGGSDELGASVRLVDAEGRFLAWGLWDPESPIAARVWTRREKERLDGKLFHTRLRSALALRSRLFGGAATNAYRLLHGEGDRAPGFVLDRYADVAVLRVDGEAAARAQERLLEAIESPLRDHGVTTLLERRGGRGAPVEIITRFGSMRTSVIALEDGVPFPVDLARGQKTGAFLDQRDNRRRIGELVTRGARVLNLFSYAGGFSLRAALAGGTVTSVDIASAAHATAQEGFRLAGVDPGGHTFVTADAFAWLEAARARGERFDVVISDPPSFAPSEKAKAKGLRAYRTLHRACVEVLAPGGTFVAASCSSHVDAEGFLSTLDEAALGTYPLRLVALYGPPPDHPTLPAFPEGRYLKLAVLR